MEVEKERRNDTCKNHSATHLLQKALRLVLGTHVEQAGSYVDKDRLRFDFTHFSAMTEEEIEKVEMIVNREIKNQLTVFTKEMSLEEARKTGAMALFGEKYGETVRVVTIGEFSTELCGGTHVKNTDSIVAFKILSETGIAAGVRRIEALTGDGVLKYYKELEKQLTGVANIAHTEPTQLAKKFEHMAAEIKNLKSENESLKNKLAQNEIGSVMDQVQEINGIKLLASKVENMDMNGLRTLGDKLKEKLENGVILLASAKDEKVSLLAMATEPAMKAGAHAGNLIKEIAKLVGGGGGGRPNMAQAGGKNIDGIESAIKQAVSVLKQQLS